MTHGMTAEGFVAKSYDEILASIVARQRATMDPAIDTSPHSVIGQFNAIVANELAALWEVQRALYDALDPDLATGAQQDALYSLTNTLRQGARKSRVTATVNLAAGANIAIGDAVASVVGVPASRFVNVGPMVNSGGAPANFSVVFEAEQTGAVIANAGTLTVIETFIAGWNSITNATNAELGSGVETDTEYRIRRLIELTVPGGGTVSGIRADLSRLPGVSAVEVLENDTDSVFDGMPPHSVEAIVRGGEAQAIAESIYSNKVGGIQTHGSEPAVEVTDDEGVAHEVYFSRPTEVPVYLAIEVEAGDGYDASDDHYALTSALVNASTNKLNPSYLDVGMSVYAGRLVCTALEVAGVLNARVGLSLSTITDPDAGTLSIPITKRELATLATARIAVVEL